MSGHDQPVNDASEDDDDLDADDGGGGGLGTRSTRDHPRDEAAEDRAWAEAVAAAASRRAAAARERALADRERASETHHGRAQGLGNRRVANADMRRDRAGTPIMPCMSFNMNCFDMVADGKPWR